ncbi:cytochrome P450 [Daldinia vernicosa]|uniref:cytochrome P450 n=1 Tax=Daldinia vernicosa TaxID=114800 RepID=UPI0020073539|nr:cytochrome P450 [Daldinia vernicosa]KAI0854359.1 cytochrome P450 [Daldinia vernicosa]
MLNLFLHHISHMEWPIAALIISLLILLVNTIYNLFFHPLANIPGPFLARASQIPSWYHAHRGDRHLWLWQQFQIYGDKIRPEPNTVLFNNPEAYPDIYSQKSNVKRSKLYRAIQLNGFEDTTLTTTDVAGHARKRKLLSLAFTENSVRAASNFVIQHLDRWNQLLIEDADSDWQPAVDISEKVNGLVFDIMGDLSFGKSFDVKEPGVNPLKAIPHSITDYLSLNYTIAHSPLLDYFVWLKPKGLDTLFAAVMPRNIRQYRHFVHDSVTERITLHQKQTEKPEAERRQDIFYFLCEARNPDTGLPAYREAELRAEANLIIIAGSDTTSISLSGLFFYLTSDDLRYQKLVREICTEFKSAEDIVYGPKLSSLVYLKACIEEGMRLTPVIPSELPREVLPGGIEIQGEYFPAGINVGMANWALSRDPEVYGDPELFRPERWIVDEATGVTEKDVERARSGSHPFAGGPGKCLGRNFGMMEMMIIVARTLHRLDVRRDSGSTLGSGGPEYGRGTRDRKQFQLFDAYISARRGPMLQFRKRQQSDYT